MKNFKQQIDVSRNPILLTKEPKRCIHLEYQYPDTQEFVTVPNIWYNQLPRNRAADLELESDKMIEEANKIRKNPSIYGFTKESEDNIAERYEKRATAMKNEADSIRSKT